MKEDLSLKSTTFESFLFDEENGFLTTLHEGRGIHESKIEELYSILENLKKCWAGESKIQKDIAFFLFMIVPGLYAELNQYVNSENHHKYESLAQKLDTSILMVLNSDITDPHWNTPLHEL